ENRSHFLYIAPGPAFHRCPVLYSPPPHCRKAGNCCLSPDRLPPLCCRRSLRACRCNSSSCCLLSGSPPQFPARRSCTDGFASMTVPTDGNKVPITGPVAVVQFCSCSPTLLRIA